MLTEKIKYIPGYIYRNLALPRILTFKNREVLSQNLALKNKIQGRCFILGSGPSINEIDIKRFADEQTFMVNTFSKHADFSSLKHTNYIIIDSGLPSKPSYEMVTDVSRKAVKNTNIFFNVNDKEELEKSGLFKNQNIYYISAQGIMSRYFDFNINIDRTIPAPKNSVLLCIIIAVYMGFKEIYLLGCEHNFLSYDFWTQDHKEQDNHYDFGHFQKENSEETEPKGFKIVDTKKVKWQNNISYENSIAHVLQLFKSYRFLYAKIKKVHPEVKIYNATPKSFLDVFPRIKYEDIKF